MSLKTSQKISRRSALRIAIFLLGIYVLILLSPYLFNLFQVPPSDVGVAVQSFNSIWLTQYPGECDTPYRGGLEIGVWNPRDRDYLIKANGSPILVGLQGNNNVVRASFLVSEQAPSLEQSILELDPGTPLTLTTASIQVDLGTSANLTLTERMCIPSWGYTPDDGTLTIVPSHLGASGDVWSSTRTEHYINYDQTIVLTLTDAVINNRHMDQAILHFSSVGNFQVGELAIESFGKNLDISLPTGVEQDNRNSRIKFLSSFYAREVDLSNPIGTLELDYHKDAIDLDGIEGALGTRDLHLGPQKSSEPFEIFPPEIYRRNSSDWSIRGYTTSVTYGNAQLIKPPWENLSPEVQVFFLSIPLAIFAWIIGRLWPAGQDLVEKRSADERPLEHEEISTDPPPGHFVVVLSSGRVVTGVLSAKPTLLHERYVLKNPQYKDKNGVWQTISAPEITIEASQVDYAYRVDPGANRMA